MKLQRREKILVMVVGGLVAVIGLAAMTMLGDDRTTEFLNTEQTRLVADIEKKENQKKVGAQEAKRLVEWQQRSLPSDPAIARSLYQDWLRSLCNRANLRGLDIHSEETEPHRDVYTRIPFSIRARANLGEVVSFLYEFYSAGHLHQIRKLDIKPTETPHVLDVTISIEGLSLPGADSKNQLSKEPGHSLHLSNLADYRDPITKRDFFTAYAPPALANTVQRSSPTSFDFAKYAVVTGFTEADGVWQVWLEDRISGKGKTWQLREGDAFEVAGTKGKVRSITPEGEAIVEYDGQRRRLHVGDNLRGGIELAE